MHPLSDDQGEEIANSVEHRSEECELRPLRGVIRIARQRQVHSHCIADPIYALFASQSLFARLSCAVIRNRNVAQ